MNRTEIIQENRAKGGRLAAVLPGRYPRALLEAHGYLAVEVWDPPVSPTAANAHLQVFACSVAQRGMALLLQGRVDADLYLFPHICDTMQNAFTVFKDCVGTDRPVLLFYLPRNSGSQGTRPYLRAQIRGLSENLAALGASTDDERLERAVRERRECVALLRELYKARCQRRWIGRNVEFYDLVRKWEYLPSRKMAEVLDQALETRTSTGARSEPGVVLSGVLPERNLLERLDENSILVLEDDLLSMGRRFRREGGDTHSDPFDCMAAELDELPPCSTVGSPLQERADFLLRLVESAAVQGVVCHTITFCEPELFDLPYLSERVKAKRIRVLTLETELHAPPSGQLATRLQAFLEMLS